MSTESITSTSPQVGPVEPCRACGAPMAEDQRYCLECGERRNAMSSVLLGGPPFSPAPAAPPAAPPSPPRGSRGDQAPRGSAVTVIAGVGVLLLAMGVGVLIGRSGGSKPAAPAAAQVISVSTAPASGASGASGTATEPSFSEDWPAGTTGYTVQLQTLPQAGTLTSAVLSAKSAAATKGAKGVGALLKDGSYVIYSGVYHKQAEAQKALAGLKKSFPDARVIKVAATGGGAAASGSSSKSGSTPAAPGSGGGKTATPKVLEELHKSGGKSYEEKSKNLPDVVGT